MNVAQTLPLAVRALLRNKLRSFLTTLGVVIGVASVISMVGVGEGARARVENVFATMGTNLLVILSGSTSSGGVMGGFGSMPTLTWADLDAIRTEVPSVRAAAPQLMSKSTLQSDDANWTTSVVGTTTDYFDIRAWSIASGCLFGPSDEESGAKVLVLGQTVAEKLFGAGVDAVNRTVRLRGMPFTVIGVLARKGQSPMGTDYDDVVYLPATTFRAKIQGGLEQYIAGAIVVSARSAADTSRAQRDIANLLRDRHHIASASEDDFSIRNLADIAAAQQQGTKALTALLAAIAVVSLVVGGIGIMNIMLVSVRERTREVGLRMAVGAKPWHVLLQFLVEAVTLSGLGGLLGVGLGIGLARFLASEFAWPYAIRVDMILVSFGVSALVGVLFGLYPAQKAAKLDPIQALRYE